ncbi:hypothetical protein CEXT_658991 [Caerostris extrusa]|uniref:Uncharacterized protein n=1 Tax=Caerostris extrusa TaxID=172846 RepID=A0AAV4P834_CAEEX|nr:hypothetical protein CEXT_658991 [Caerostris extrusa]
MVKGEKKAAVSGDLVVKEIGSFIKFSGEIVGSHYYFLGPSCFCCELGPPWFWTTGRGKPDTRGGQWGEKKIIWCPGDHSGVPSGILAGPGMPQTTNRVELGPPWFWTTGRGKPDTRGWQWGETKIIWCPGDHSGVPLGSGQVQECLKRQIECE